MSLPEIVQVGAGKVFSIAISGNVLDSEIDSQEVNMLILRWFRKIHDQQEVEHIIYQNQVSLTLDPTLFDNPLMVSTDNEGNLDSPFQCHKGNMVNAHTHVALVVYNCAQQTKRMWFLRLLVCFVSFNHFSNGPNSHLRRKTKLLFHIVVAQFMYLDLAMGFVLKGDLANVVACFIKTNHGFFQDSMLFIVCEKFDFCRN
jgi:hypothetical protein